MRFRRRSCSVILVLASLASATPAWATTYYVSVEQGSDQGDGLSPTSAVRSLAQATEQLMPGDHLVIESGHYSEPLRLTKSGTAAAPIEVGGSEGALPQIRTDGDAVTIAADYIRLSRIDAASSGDLGSAIVVQPGHHHVKITDTVAHDSGCGGIAAIQTDHIEIRHNRVFGNGMRSPWQCSGISLYQAANVDDAPGFHNVISGNLAYGNMNKVPDPKLPARAAGHTTDGNGIIIDDFRHDQVWQGRKTPRYRAATLVENNIAYGNGGRGIEVFYSDDVSLRNNTSSGNLLDARMVDGTYGEIYVAFADHIKIFNNLVDAHGNKAFAIMLAHTKRLDGDYNMMVGGKPPGLGRDAAEISWGSHNFLADAAGFTSEGDHDFHLMPNSKAVNAGSPARGSSLDLDGAGRPGDGTVDIGAYQHRR
ncbi:MAG: Parallel beta-helix repeat protein [Rhodospirillales bacterium]|nr:Parallel beta-helix repeat protein [Rhodospirillales bacterium]